MIEPMYNSKTVMYYFFLICLRVLLTAFSLVLKSLVHSLNWFIFSISITKLSDWAIVLEKCSSWVSVSVRRMSLLYFLASTCALTSEANSPVLSWIADRSASKSSHSCRTKRGSSSASQSLLRSSSSDGCSSRSCRVYAESVGSEFSEPVGGKSAMERRCHVIQTTNK